MMKRAQELQNKQKNTCICLQHLNNIVIQEIDSSNGVIFPFYDPDTNMIYLCGKVSQPAETLKKTQFICPAGKPCF